MDIERLKNAPEIKEVIPKREIAFAFIKPDFLEDLPVIETILLEHGLEVIYRDKVHLNEMAVDSIYKESKNEHFYDTMKKYLTTHEVIVLMVGGKGLEAQKVLLNLKKTGDKNGIIRERLQKEPPVKQEDVELWERKEHPNQDEVSILLTQSNVIHTADSTEEALASLKLIFGDKFEDMKKKGNLPAELWDIFEKDNTFATPSYSSEINK
ncbi:MAG: nucleoside-diphosphate kinase [Patescibacteria group bacterium]|nr:nucleoside-diphosphate kinase [Patescibacteria group bacterium]